MENENDEVKDVVETEEVKTNEETREVETEDTEETIDWEAKAKELEGRLKRAETKLSKEKPKQPSKSSELDYGQKAFLTANGIKGAKEYEFVQSELKKSGEELSSLLENDYFKQRLNDFRELNKTSEATPTGKRSGGVAIDSVDYWMTKPIEEVPADMRIKVVNAKLAKEKEKGVFYNSN